MKGPGSTQPEAEPQTGVNLPHLLRGLLGLDPSAVSSMLGSSTTAGSLLSSNTTFSLAIELCLDKALGGMELVKVLLDGDEDAGMLAAAEL